MIDRERRAWMRFLIVVAVGALGELVGVWLRLPFRDSAVPLLFGAAAYYLTMGLTVTRSRGNANVRYWRGRRVDDN